VQIFGIKNANPFFYVKYVENGYFPLLSKFEMFVFQMGLMGQTTRIGISHNSSILDNKFQEIAIHSCM
jgi:hypothetical protein